MYGSCARGTPRAASSRKRLSDGSGLEKRIGLFTSLRIEELDRLALKRKVDEIGNLDRG